MWERVGHFILKNRKGVLLFWILYVLFMGFSGRNVDISYHFAKMLPANDSVFTTYNRFQEEFDGSGSSIVLGAKDDSFFTPSVLNAWKDMAERLEKEKEVIGVLSLHNAVDMVLGDQEGERMKSVPIMSGEVDSPQKAFNIRDHYDALPIYHGLLSSRDNKTHLMAISITEKANYSEIIYDLFDRIHVETKRFERRTGIPIEVSGLPYLRLNNARSIKGEINLFMFLTALGTVLIMLILLRSMRAALIALTAPIALRSIQGTCTKPPIGSQVRPRLCSMPISAAFRHLAGVPFMISASAEPVIAHAEPTSPWQPTSAPEIEAFCLIRLPIAVAFSKNLRTPSWL